MTFSFYWHDYETWGATPRWDRAAQFAGLRTDEDLNPVGEPLVIYCQPADDMLPQPEACMVTGITPQKALAEGLVEAEFMGRIHREMAHPGTCGVGYNTIRFDDEVTRYGFYRNFFDPYAREWQNGNSRWDIIDMVRLTHALRPEGVEWPRHPDGKPSFRLEHLTAANGISHQSAHDALSDVHATIAMARLVKEKQPRLYDYIFRLRKKQAVGELLNLQARKPVLHVSSMYPSEHGCIAMVMPLAAHPTNSNGVIVFDLRYDPTPLLTLSEDEIHQRLFTPTADLPEGVERMPLKTVHLNKCPVVVPMNTLSEEAAERWQVDVRQGEQHRQTLLAADGLKEKLGRIHQKTTFEKVSDPDQNLYGGGFFSADDRRRMEQIRAVAPGDLSSFPQVFDDQRLPEMLFRYRARNWPETLSDEERESWEEYRQARLFEPGEGPGLPMDDYLARLDEMEMDESLAPEKRRIIPELLAWAEKLAG
ncbi:MAG: exodeoxyribonuclease I [endosymbiont of Seepiophila jonesi]|uniref:Exodeoxyribonuclease I n=1 Tax=endosymbiont of Lamellibrachia luymesi TaxID=2200907 RepID=A0A370DZ54_9GAMM|nr:MAG: exodeoxyribonuclease I [endosymbiont of Lamellibrachia luymesi]RDH92837.1 MAG: exodeoxyribonuclease I [endosymbiont of Seepiophila jonesi]